MKRNFINAVSATGALGLLLALPGLANAGDYFRKTRAYRLEPDPDPPAYVRKLSQTQFEQFRDVDWLNVGLDHRTRYEYRENDYRYWTQTNSTTGTATRKYRADPDNLFLLRTRAYVGITDILDPFRFAVEFQNSSSENGHYERSDSDVNEHELIQAYGELYFKNALGFNRPLSVRAGRMAYEVLDRRLLARNEFRNTTNNFLGYRVRFGKQQNDWDLDTFALQPLERLKYQWDKPDEDTWFYGGILSIRRWSEFITIQPYFMGRKVNGDPTNSVVANRKADMDIYAPGLRVYGVFPNSSFDFDADINKQFGRYVSLSTNATNRRTTQTLQQHDALAYAIELGYTFDHDWKPRTSVFYGFGTGDKNPVDNNNQRFDAFYGFNQPWSRNDYFSWDNIHAPKARLEFVPYKDVRVDTGYNAYWLESDTGAWTRANLQDRTGKSGSFLGHEFDVRVRHKFNPYVEWTMSYAYLSPGDFTRAQNNNKTDTGPYTSQATNFFYLEVSLNAFGDGKPTYK